LAVASVLTTWLLAGCAATPDRQAESAAPPDSTLCDVYGYERGSKAYAQCAAEVDKAMWRAARSARARVNCTPMGEQTVCR
jgi:hypothetical protein